MQTTTESDFITCIQIIELEGLFFVCYHMLFVLIICLLSIKIIFL